MHLVKAALATVDVEPGWRLVKDDVPLGKEYVIDLDRIEPATITSLIDGRSKRIDVVYVAAPTTGFMPLFAFKVHGEA